MISVVCGKLLIALLFYFSLIAPPCSDMKSNNYTLNKCEEFASHSQHILYTRAEDTL